MRTMQLLQTKLQRPRVPRHFVPRPRLSARLDQGSQGPLTLVCAGAGYGKTTLVSAWIESLAAGNQSRREPVAWIALDERDSDLGLFLHYFIAGLRTMFVDACPATFSLLRATRQPPFTVLSATLINEIAALPQDFILVLDDYQWITGTAVPELFNEFERHWPQSMHLVLISRHTPTLSLAPWRAKGQLTEIRASRLAVHTGRSCRISGTGAADAPQPTRHRTARTPHRGLDRRLAVGQPVAAGCRRCRRPGGRSVGRGCRIRRVFGGDVLAQQPPAIVSFLLQTAILDPFCVALCEAVISTEDPEWSAHRCIEWVERRNLFVSSLDSHKEWYGYHQMFRSMLLQHAMAELGPDRIAELQRKAAAWFAQHGLADEAIRHALAAGDRELAAGFIAQGLADVLNREDRPTLDRWLGYFPDEFVQNRLDLLIVRGFSLFLSWQVGPLARLLHACCCSAGATEQQRCSRS